MNNVKKASGTAIAAAAAALMMSGYSYAAGMGNSSTEAKIHCYVVNACKGMTDCKTANNACKGHNSCKGTGWLSMTAEECTTAGGSMTEK